MLASSNQTLYDLGYVAPIVAPIFPHRRIAARAVARSRDREVNWDSEPKGDVSISGIPWDGCGGFMGEPRDKQCPFLIFQ